MLGPATAQDQLLQLLPNKQETFKLIPGAGRSYVVTLKEGDVANITWLVSDSVLLKAGVLDPSGKPLEAGRRDNLLFVAPTAGMYKVLFLYDEESEAVDTQSITIEYSNGFSLPKGSRLKDLRSLAGYNIRIYWAGKDMDGATTVVFDKGGLKKRILQDFGSDYIGYTFSDTVEPASSATARKRAALIKNTPDKTGNGIPDVMIDYFSGGAHCCFTTFFFDLGSQVELVEQIDTQHAGIAPIGINPKGGLRFETHENNFAYWNACFACSPMPRIILEFEKGVLKPNFELLRKKPPSLVELKGKARKARAKVSLEPYTEDGAQFDEAFWDVMLDLIYTGNEDLAWQYFDLVWPARKQGKELFLANFREILASSYYGTRDTDSQNGFQNYWKGFNKILETIKINQ
ncbi:MAG: hypothetical protein ABR530_03950 [Pyrinomonadaceae bacterium]